MVECVDPLEAKLFWENIEMFICNFLRRKIISNHDIDYMGPCFPQRRISSTYAISEVADNANASVSFLKYIQHNKY